VTTRPYPGFPTDAQAHLVALACLGEGRSVIRETLYEDRFRQVDQLLKMGAEICIRRDEAVIAGRRRLVGAEVSATDLQAGAALILAGLGADGVTRVHGYHHVRRGYPDLVQRLEQVGTSARRVA
jgi:UDP-N-acetylglucosamine 1-carboxyvinyltransferase